MLTHLLAKLMGMPKGCRLSYLKVWKDSEGDGDIGKGANESLPSSLRQMILMYLDLIIHTTLILWSWDVFCMNVPSFTLLDGSSL